MTALGLLLLTAAGLKLSGLPVSPVPAVGSLSSPRLGLSVALGEIALGLGLILSTHALVWLAALGTFAAFALVSGYFGVIGIAHCGCFGAVKASPWAAFAIDLVAVALLLLARPRNLLSALSPLGRRAILGIAVPAVALAIAAGIAMATFGGVGPALAALRGEALGLSTGYLEFPPGRVGDRLTASLDVTNFSAAPLRIVGGTSDCSCTATHDLPLTIPPGETRPVTIELKVPNTKAGQFTRTAILWTDSPDQRALEIGIGCRVK